MGFNSDWDKAQKKLEKELENIVKVAGINLFNGIIQLSPVQQGRFRANWQATINTPATDVLFQSVPPSEEENITSVDNVGQKLKSFKLNDTIYLTNNLPYAERLENGWSQQRPRKWVARATSTAQKYLDAAIAKRLK